jgi:hypothetical protein
VLLLRSHGAQPNVYSFVVVVYSFLVFEFLNLKT